MGVLAAVRLRCEYGVNPVGVGEMVPRLSWEVRGEGRGVVQGGYAIRVGTVPGGEDVWVTGKVESGQSVFVPYGGAKLRSRVRYYWQVKVWGADGSESPWSEVAYWEMGLLKGTDWTASWISVPEEFEGKTVPPARYLRRGFSTHRAVSRARLYMTARGVFVAYINGKRVGEDVFAPGWSDYGIRQRYCTYDVTDLVRTGTNMLGVVLGDGWYAGHIAWTDRGNYGQAPMLLGQLHVEYTDGSYEVIRTDDGWEWSTEGPIRGSDMLMGETYDARKEMAGWATAESQVEFGGRVRVDVRGKVPLEAYVGPPVRKQGEIVPREAWRTAEGTWVFDLGQNMVGWARLKVRGATGQAVRLRFAEMLKPDRTLYLENLRKAKATDTYVCRGEGVEVWEPTFTYHGFRYVELAGLAAGQTPGLDTVTGVVVHSDTPATGTFACSDERLNQLQHNIVWGQKGNFVEVPTDCPQRDERLGWTGDAQVFARTAAFNMDVSGFFARWLTDLDDAQTKEGAYPSVAPQPAALARLAAGVAAWADAGVICPWTMHKAYGDVRVLERHYEAMKKFIRYMQNRWPDFMRHEGEWTYGDWLAIDSWTPRELIGAAYFAYSAKLMGEMAGVLGKESDAARFGRLFERAKKAFNHAFVTPSGRLAGDSQTAYLLALRFGLLSEEKRAAAAKFLARDIEMRGVLTTGFVGVNLLLPTLTEIGRDDLAFKLLLNEKFPSWLYSVKNGATTIWERWDGWTEEKGFQTPSMNSFNHYAYGSCGEWMYACIGGIELGAAGYKEAVIWPRVGGGITHAKATLETPYGVIATAWETSEAGFALNLSVPANTTAWVVLPAGSVEGVRESGVALAEAEGVRDVSAGDGVVRCRAGSGKYVFACAAFVPAMQ